MTKALWSDQRIKEFVDLDGQEWGDLSLQFQGYASDWDFRRSGPTGQEK